MRGRWLTTASLLFAGAFLHGGAQCQPAARRVFQVDVPAPTKDKPQSKLWFAHGDWWAWLPVKGGSAVWRRAGGEWRRESHLDQSLMGLPGQADVWADKDGVRAVLAAPDALAVVHLRWDRAERKYRLGGPPARIALPRTSGAPPDLETATIARDSRGRWWLAYNSRRSMWVRWSRGNPGASWSEPVMITSTKASADDLCAIVAVRDRVGVIWSDQVQDAILVRWREDRSPPDRWVSGVNYFFGLTTTISPGQRQLPCGS